MATARVATEKESAGGIQKGNVSSWVWRRQRRRRGVRMRRNSSREAVLISPRLLPAPLQLGSAFTLGPGGAKPHTALKLERADDSTSGNGWTTRLLNKQFHFPLQDHFASHMKTDLSRAL